MATAIFMPKNGMAMEEGVLVRWLVKEGDKVEMDQPIMEIETDKITMEDVAPASGTILALYAKGWRHHPRTGNHGLDRRTRRKG